MAFNIGLSRTFPGFGVSLTQTGVNVIAGIPIATATAYYIPSTTPYTSAYVVPLAVGVTSGRMRVKIYNGAGTSPTVTKLQVQASDGTNKVVIFDQNYGTAVTLSTTSWLDEMFDFIVDTAASGSGGGATGQLIAPTSSAAGGITQFIVTPTLGGTSVAATMDVEFFGLI
jgi:hypothetical protein